MIGVLALGVMLEGLLLFVWGLGSPMDLWGTTANPQLSDRDPAVLLNPIEMGQGVLLEGWVSLRSFPRSDDSRVALNGPPSTSKGLLAVEIADF